MSQQYQVVKTIIPAQCPHCAKEILISYQTMIPSLSAVVRKEDVTEAKKALKARLEDVKFKDNKTKEGIIKWIDDEKTLLTNVDIEDIVKQIQTDEGETK